MKLSAQNSGTDHACCHGDHHSTSDTGVTAPERKRAKKYFCPMCEGVESDTRGSCPMCGMSLERNPAFSEPETIIYTCPMHPQIQQDRPGNCPICGMTLEPTTIGAGGEQEQHEVRSLARKFWIALVLTIPVVIIAMGHVIPGLQIDAIVPREIAKWTEFGLTTPVVLWAGAFFFARG